MARQSPLWQQGNSYSASMDRGLMGALWPAGGATGAVTTAVPDTMDVSIAPGRMSVVMIDQSGSLCTWDEAEIVTLPDAPATGLTRRDLVICRVRDAAVDGGADNDFVFETVSGPDIDSNLPYDQNPLPPDNAASVWMFQLGGGIANLNAAPNWDYRPQQLAVPPPALHQDVDLQYGATWISTGGASQYVISWARAFPSAPWFRMGSAGTGMPYGMTCVSTGQAGTTWAEFQAFGAGGEPFGAGAVLFVHYIVGYTPGTRMAHLRPAPPEGAMLPKGVDLERDAMLREQLPAHLRAEMEDLERRDRLQ